jgi:magnesium-transporting ATPase (P-type)
MVARLGNVIYWLFSGLAAICLAVSLLAFGIWVTGNSHDPASSIFSGVAMAIAAVACWLVGRMSRYVLAGI